MLVSLLYDDSAHERLKIPHTNFEILMIPHTNFGEWSLGGNDVIPTLLLADIKIFAKKII